MKQGFNKVRSCSAQPAISPKPEFKLDLTGEALKILMYPLEEILGGNFFSAEMCLELIRAILLKRSQPQGCSGMGSASFFFFKISEDFLRGSIVIPFIQEVVT